MIASKNQLVRLVSRPEPNPLTALHNGRLVNVADNSQGNQTAKVRTIVYHDQPEGQRGVGLDRELGGSCWHSEADLELAE